MGTTRAACSCRLKGMRLLGEHVLCVASGFGAGLMHTEPDVLRAVCCSDSEVGLAHAIYEPLIGFWWITNDGMRDHLVWAIKLYVLLFICIENKNIFIIISVCFRYFFRYRWCSICLSSSLSLYFTARNYLCGSVCALS